MNYIYKDVEFLDAQVFRTALRKIYGIGSVRSNFLCDLVGLSKICRTEFVNSYYLFVILFLIKDYYGTDVFLKRMRENRLKDFLSFKSYKSIRFSAGLPIRGQHTHTNARTAKFLKRTNKRF